MSPWVHDQILLVYKRESKWHLMESLRRVIPINNANQVVLCASLSVWNSFCYLFATLKWKWNSDYILWGYSQHDVRRFVILYRRYTVQAENRECYINILLAGLPVPCTGDFCYLQFKFHVILCFVSF
uniref:Uncharacterized protein n=1 Tax=Lotus japonicus TaxID=34305 RepID=I3SWI9_LOTJA|nr:unknown [Lotus japonicus]